MIGDEKVQSRGNPFSRWIPLTGEESPEILRKIARDYDASVGGEDSDDEMTLAYQWQDKKHRHVHDLTNLIIALADRIENLESVRPLDTEVLAQVKADPI